MKSLNEFLNEAKKNIRGEVLGTDFKIYNSDEGKHIILIVGDGSDQYEHPYYLKKNDTIDKLKKRFYKGKSITIPNPLLKDDLKKLGESRSDRDHKYNSIAKIAKALGKGQPSDDEIKAFIKKEYDLDKEDDADIVADIMGYYHLDPEDFFDEDGNLLEAKAPITPESVASFLTTKFPNGPKAKYDIGVNDTDGEYDVFIEYDCATKKGFVNAKDTIFIDIDEDGFISFYNNFGTNKYPKTTANLVKEIKSIIAQDKKDITY